MAEINVEVKPHPAQLKFNGEPLFDDDGNPVSAAPNHRSVWLNGRLIGYCGDTANKPFNFIAPPSQLPSNLREIVVEKAATQLGGDWHDATKVSQAPDIPEELLSAKADD